MGHKTRLLNACHEATDGFTRAGRGGFLSSLENAYIEASVSRMKEAFEGPLSCEVSGRNSPISSVVMVPKVD